MKRYCPCAFLTIVFLASCGGVVTGSDGESSRTAKDGSISVLVDAGDAVVDYNNGNAESAANNTASSDDSFDTLVEECRSPGSAQVKVVENTARRALASLQNSNGEVDDATCLVTKTTQITEDKETIKEIMTYDALGEYALSTRKRKSGEVVAKELNIFRREDYRLLQASKMGAPPSNIYIVRHFYDCGPSWHVERKHLEDSETRQLKTIVDEYGEERGTIVRRIDKDSDGETDLFEDYHFDAKGLIIQREIRTTDGRGIVRRQNYVYGDTSRIVKETDDLDADGVPEIEINYNYHRGKPSGMINRRASDGLLNRKSKIKYNKRGLPTSREFCGGVATREEFEHDESGRIVRLVNYVGSSPKCGVKKTWQATYEIGYEYSCSDSVSDHITMHMLEELSFEYPGRTHYLTNIPVVEP